MRCPRGGTSPDSWPVLPGGWFVCPQCGQRVRVFKRALDCTSSAATTKLADHAASPSHHPERDDTKSTGSEARTRREQTQ